MAGGVQPDWRACRFGEAPVFALGLPVELATRLWAAGYRTVGALDEAFGEYREAELRRLLGRDGYRVTVRALLGYCRRKLLSVIAEGRGDGR